MRRIIAVLLSLILLGSTARAEGYAFRFEGGAAVVDENGTTIIAPGIYEDLYALYADDGTVAGYAAGTQVGGALRYAILSPEGEERTDFSYTSVAWAGASFICGADGSYRIVSGAGAESADAYAAIAYAGDGAFLTLSGNVNDDIADPLALLAENGIKWQMGIYVLYGLGMFSEDLMPVCDGGSVRFGYIGRDGAWKIPAQYEYAGDFKDGYAVVSTQTGYGVIDATGAVAVNPDFDFIEREGNRILAVKGGALALYEVGADGLSKAFETDVADASPRLSGASVVLYGSEGVTVLGADGAARFVASPTASVSEAGGLYVVRDGDWAAASAYLANGSGVPVSAKYNTIRLLEGEGENALFAYGVMAADSYDIMFGMMRGDGEIVTEAKFDEFVRVGPGLFCATEAGDASLIDGSGGRISGIE